MHSPHCLRTGKCFLIVLLLSGCTLRSEGERQIPERSGLPSGNLVSATSRDGLTWTKGTIIVAENANTPGALFDGTHMRVYFCRKSEVQLAISRDGTTWEEKRVIVSGLPRGMIALDPEVVLLPDGRYRMYYYEHPRAKGIPLALEGEFVIASAISDDGLAFEREQERFRHERSMDPDVIATGSFWRMFLSQDGKTVIALSRDGGESFVYDDYLRFGDRIANKFITSTVETDDGYRMYFNSMAEGKREKPSKIYSAFSPDGERWTMDPGVRIEGSAEGSLDEYGAGSMAALRTADGTYWLFYVSEQ